MKTVITYGVFDLFHVGHLNLLRRARALGDRLIVGVTTDEFTSKRGKIDLTDTLSVRMENVRNSGYADEIIAEEFYGQKIMDVQKYNVDVFVIGDDWEGQFDYLKEFCEVVYLPRTPNISTSRFKHMKKIKMGVLGTGRVSRRFLEESRYVSKYMEIEGAYSRNPDNRKVFCEGYKIREFSDCDELIEASNAVYVATPHETHPFYIRRALENGKHVFSEKPMALSKREAEELFDLAEERGLVLFEGIKTAYCPGFSRLLAVAKSGSIGRIHEIESTFTRLTDRRFREWTDEKYGGSFLEFGSYTMLPVLKLMGTEGVDFSFRSVLADNGIDSYTRFTAEKGDMFASGKNGIGVKSEGEMIISGEKGYILVSAPWWKTTHFEVRGEDPTYREEYDIDFLTEGFRYELFDFINQIYGNRVSSYKLTRQESVKMAEVFEQFLGERNKR